MLSRLEFQSADAKGRADDNRHPLSKCVQNPAVRAPRWQIESGFPNISDSCCTDGGGVQNRVRSAPIRWSASRLRSRGGGGCWGARARPLGGGREGGGGPFLG